MRSTEVRSERNHTLPRLSKDSSLRSTWKDSLLKVAPFFGKF